MLSCHRLPGVGGHTGSPRPGPAWQHPPSPDRTRGYEPLLSTGADGRTEGALGSRTPGSCAPPPQTQSLVAPPLARGLRAAAANPVLEVLGCGPESSFLSAGRSQAWASGVRERKAAGRLQEPQDSGDKGLTAGWPSDGGADRDPGHVEQTWGVSALPPGQPRKHALSHARGTASSTSRASCSEDGRLPAVERSANLPARSGGGTRHIGWTSGSPRTSTQSHG